MVIARWYLADSRINKAFVLILAVQKRYEQAGEDPEKGHKDNQMPGKPDIRETIKKLCLFSFEKLSLREDLNSILQPLKVGYREDGDSTFTRSHMQKMTGDE